jgi:hypothetical protein
MLLKTQTFILYEENNQPLKIEEFKKTEAA